MLDRVEPERIARLKGDLEQALWQRNQALRDAARAGVDRKTLAEAAKISPGRLSQILNHRSGHHGS